MDCSKSRRILLPAAVSLLILFIIIVNSDAKIGYNINVDVSGTKWSRSQITEVLNFRTDGQITGTGNSSKYVNIPGFAGIGVKETTYTKKGKLSNTNNLNITAKLNWIYINENIDDHPAINKTIFENGTVIYVPVVQASSHYYAEINESIPTLVRSEDETYYSGEGIYTRNRYVNDQDLLCTDYYANNLSKAARFAGVYSNAMIITDIIPGNINELDLTNSATAFRLQSISDKSTRLKYQSGSSVSDEEYVGKFKIDRKFSRRSTFNFSRGEDDWLGCGCYPDREFISSEYKNCKCIFDAYNPLPNLGK
ncbi:MAG: hypothetical protein ACE14P_03095 [Methanotrichaceae archaeon]